ncbi:hypothetical protein Scep_005897 [Stephania cephalantha]|uniref:Uncharacterized protein n=1 Tax=Stephania cephalantha TaxID=152367 RepID=A0AAP0PWU4_9MAGN
MFVLMSNILKIVIFSELLSFVICLLVIVLNFFGLYKFLSFVVDALSIPLHFNAKAAEKRDLVIQLMHQRFSFRFLRLLFFILKTIFCFEIC